MKHLTYDDRLDIQKLLREGLNFTQIAIRINRDRATISREVRQRRNGDQSARGNSCQHKNECSFPESCNVAGCLRPYRCRTLCTLCQRNCTRYEEETCLHLDFPPYVCNGCRKHNCRLRHWDYDAKKAQADYETRLKQCRQGIALTQGDFQFLYNEIAPLIHNGLSVQAVCNTYAGSMPICAKTVYAYINMGILGLNNLDLHRKVRRPLRKKSGPSLKVDRQCYKERTYADYLDFMEENPHLPVCQMDSVEGKKGGKVILTLHFTNCNLQLMYLRLRNTADSVSEVFSKLRTLLGEDFPRLFPVILTDRGSEFSNPEDIEYNPTLGIRECRVFYCDPQQVNQKSSCERNHELIRYILPKGKSFESLDQEDMTLVMNQINSYPRAKWNNLCPIELFEKIYGTSLTKKIGIMQIPVNALCLKPCLLKK